jgi:O-antigen ligase
MNYVFPAAFLANTFAVTAMMIVLGLAGQSDAAADFGIVHGATVALLHSFSGNARSIILNPSSPISTSTVLGTRMLLLLPLGVMSWLLSTHVATVEAMLAFVLVLRRCTEWIAEVRVSEMELRNEHRQATRFTILQTVLFLAVSVWLIADLPLQLAALFAWATSPAWTSARFVQSYARLDAISGSGLMQLLPHFGATAVVGISVYVFRLLILLLVGKTIAGDLYTAFAIGGMLGSVFAQAIGPTLALHEARGGPPPLWLKAVLALAAATGLAVCILAAFDPSWLDATGKPGYFWEATGYSLIGGTLMILAQQLRLRMLQHYADKDVFGPDVLINILIVAAVPYVFYLAGSDALGYLYLMSSVLALVFYWSAETSAGLWSGAIRPLAAPLKKSIAFLLLLPLFFQLSGRIFREPAHDYDTAGALMQLPIPLSVLACYGGIVLLGGYARARLSLTVIFATFTLMLVSSVMLASGQGSQEQAKLILLIQFVLPMFALVLGQIYRESTAEKPVLAETFFWLLAVLVPAQLIATWVQGKIVLTPYLYLFSIYQNLQYVPSIFVATYLLVLYSLWHVPGRRPLLFALGALMGVYTASSVSSVAMAILVAGVIAFAMHAARRKTGAKVLVILAVVVTTLAAGYFSLASGRTIFADKYQRAGADAGKIIAMPQNVVERLTYWKFYGGSIFSDAYTAALGHATPPDRTRNPSAHNYYLDFAYNFGLVALLPMLALLGFTFAGIWRRRREIMASSPLLGLTLAVMFLVLIDNSLKVGMRQPYPGILTFFLWGVLLSQLFAPSPTDGSGRAA